MALVCRAWKDAAHSEVLWALLAKELIPRLSDEDRRLTQHELKTEAAGSYRHYLVRSGRPARERRLLDDYNWAAYLMLQCEVWDVDGFCMLSTENIMVDSYGDEVDIQTRGPGPLFSVGARPRFNNPPPQTLREFLRERLLRIHISVHDERTGRRMDLWPERYMYAAEVFHEDVDLLVLTEARQMSSLLAKSPESVDVRVGLRFSPINGVNGDGNDQTLWRVDCAFLRCGDADDLSVGRLIWSVLQ